MFLVLSIGNISQYLCFLCSGSPHVQDPYKGITYIKSGALKPDYGQNYVLSSIT